MGRVVISTGKVKTDCSREIKNETIKQKHNQNGIQVLIKMV